MNNTFKVIQGIVVVSDSEKNHTKNLTKYSRKRDKAGATNVNNLIRSLRSICSNVVLYTSPKDFIDNISAHKQHIVFPYWHGENSRNRFALISAICESYEIPYVGGDTYSNIVCGDKIISKDICRIGGVKYPKYFVVDKLPLDLKSFDLVFPLVVKPVYEGSSVGITQENIVHSIEKLYELTSELFKEFNQPILVEEFIAGEEICISIIGYRNIIEHWGAIRRVKLGDPYYFNRSLYGFYDKVSKDFIDEDATSLVTKEMQEGIFKVFKWLDKIEYIRVDGRIYNSEFYCIELSNDTSLNKSGAFFNALSYSGLSYDESVKAMVNNCLKRYNSQCSN